MEKLLNTRISTTHFIRWMRTVGKNGSPHTIITIESYVYGIDKIAIHWAENEEGGVILDLYNIDIDKLKEIAKEYSRNGKYEYFGDMGNGTNRAAINKLVSFRLHPHVILGINLSVLSIPRKPSPVVPSKDPVITKDPSEPLKIVGECIEKCVEEYINKYSKETPGLIPEKIITIWQSAYKLCAQHPSTGGVRLRVCLEAMLEDLYGLKVKEKENKKVSLSNRINILKKSCPECYEEAYDYIREVGNKGAHPEETEITKIEILLMIILLLEKLKKYYGNPEAIKKCRRKIRQSKNNNTPGNK